MKACIFFCLVSTFTFFAQAESTSKLMLFQDGEVIDVQQLVDSEELAYSIDRNSKFCFEGKVEGVLDLMKTWNTEGHFFSGGGGGYIIEKVYATKKGVAGPKINLVIRSEVTDEIEDTIYIFPCR